jgi:nicotinate-nucleotide pyrophosphorylase (carboxylating)
MHKEFRQLDWDEQLSADWQELLRLAVREDLGVEGDLTTAALVPTQAVGRAAVAVRRPGVVAGLPAVETTLAAIEPTLRWTPQRADGDTVARGDWLGVIEGRARGILAAERLVLNVLGRLSGIATLTRKYVDAVAGTGAGIYDTRKTTPGWRRLEKYAVRCGGGWNHREGLFAAVLIKDNHLALGAELSPQGVVQYTPAQAVARARQFFQGRESPIVEIEVDTLEQLDMVLAAGPDLVLLDNMPTDVLRQAVARRDAYNAAVELEASGGVDLSTVRGIAETGVERISIGALTHSAAALDIGLDWLTQ